MNLELVPTYILHIRPFQDSSAILDCLTKQHGIVSIVGRGVKRPRSKFYGLIQPFILLKSSWTGRGELKTLTQIEADVLYPTLTGQKILMGLYLNELLMRLLQRFDPHPQLFDDYDKTVRALSLTNNEAQEQIILRQFELTLLRELGYALTLTHEGRKQAPIMTDVVYGYDPNLGIIELEQSKQNVTFSGASIIALREGQFDNATQLREAKMLIRTVLSQHLGNKPLETRKLFTQLTRVNEHD